MFKLNFIFTKQREMRYISHLDLMRLFMRALRRADMPLKISEGFNPHPKLSLKRALKLGVESENEEATVGLVRLVRCEDFQEKLQAQLPEGIIIKAASYECNVT
ncbi:MAG: TIGR03936 family radical SAM-associated protein [Candidatus Omnitrophica bacterium]|nr:TIGR03936 family radical SAM-associated protein [Candidatus Omnitrophota bacterium]